MILTSETIYSAENYQCLHDNIKDLLKPQGTAYPFNNSLDGLQTCIVGLRNVFRHPSLSTESGILFLGTSQGI